MTNVLEVSPISPPAGAAGELMVPLAFFDYSWLHFHPIRHLLFYDFPCSEPFFLSTLLPKLKESLSLSLSHYLLVAGNLLYPSDPHQKKPVLRYRPGDSVSLTVAVSTNDFDELTGNHARGSDQFYDFVPPMPPPPVADDPEYKIVPLMALQVTLFPGRGVCLGLSLHHCLGDARSILGFMSAWASINKHGEHYSLPIFDRSVIQDTYGIDTIFWDDQRCIPFDPSSSFPTPTGRVRARFILRHADIKKLKELVLAKREVDVSSFVVTTAYVWSCLAKAKAIPDDETELLFFTADARRLISPAVPENYFGNCLAGGAVIMEHKKLVGEEGFVSGAEAIAEDIKRLVKGNKDEFVKNAKDWVSNQKRYEGIKSVVAVAGSPKFEFGDADFGWEGKLRSQEIVSFDEEKYSMWLSRSMDGLEVGLSLPPEMMDAFARVFAHGLNS